jgi:gamma-glutamyltranspeptidase
VRASRLSVTKTPIEVPHAAVTAGHPLGAAVGLAVLRRGGNAVDAAVSTAFAMAVVEPFMSCLAGGGSMLIHRPRSGTSTAIDFNVEAPGAAHARMYRLGAGRGSDLFAWPAEGEQLFVDDRLGPGTVAALRRLGHPVVPQAETYSSFFFARPQVIQVRNGTLVTGVDHLRPAAAMGF